MIASLWWELAPIGLGVVLFARATGAEVAVVDHDPERAQTAAVLADVGAINAENDALRAVQEFTSGGGFDIVSDATGNRVAMEQGIDFVAHGGRYVFVSVVKESITFSDPDFIGRNCHYMEPATPSMRILSA